jgi:hypothetical protein
MANGESPIHSFPADLAAQVANAWNEFIAGEYTPPPLPEVSQLKSLLEIAYFAGMETDEARPLRFMLCCTRNSDPITRQREAAPVESWEFTSDRPFTIQEIRRLAAVTNLDSSAIWIRFSDDAGDKLSIRGLVNLGRSWSVARNAFAYHYEPLPHALLVRVVAPGRLVIYQSEYCIATLEGGTLRVGEPRMAWMDLLGADPLFKEGHDILRNKIAHPLHEHPREWHGFEWLAYQNTVLAVVNGIHLGGHGGALILKSPSCDLIQNDLVRIKYRLSQHSDHLKKHFVAFMNLRHKFGDMIWLSEGKEKTPPSKQEIELTSFLLRESQQKLAQACSFIGGFAGTDGAVVLNNDLTVEGFGSEIVLDKVKPAKAFEVDNPMEKEGRRELDSEQKGMRHRSAIRLCATEPRVAIFVASQDGGISLVWNKDGDVCFKSGITTTNVNMVLA